MLRNNSSNNSTGPTPPTAIPPTVRALATTALLRLRAIEGNNQQVPPANAPIVIPNQPVQGGSGAARGS